MYRVYKVEGFTNSMFELAPITKEIKVLPSSRKELFDCTSSFEASDNHFVHKRDKEELNKLIISASQVLILNLIIYLEQ